MTKLYIWRDNLGTEYWCFAYDLESARAYMNEIYDTRLCPGFFENPPYKMNKTPLAVTVCDPYKTIIRKVGI